MSWLSRRGINCSIAIISAVTRVPDDTLADSQIDPDALHWLKRGPRSAGRGLAVPAEGQLRDPAAIETGDGILGLIVVNLAFERPDQDDDVLRYVNLVLLPSIRGRHAE